jgi:hypothetical protein
MNNDSARYWPIIRPIKEIIDREEQVMHENVVFWADLLAGIAELFTLSLILWVLHRLWKVNYSMLRVLRRMDRRTGDISATACGHQA